MSNRAYTRGKALLADYDWAGDSVQIGALLVENDYVFSASHNTIADVLAGGTEASGTGYDRLTVGSANRTTFEDDTAGLTYLRITDGSLQWSSLDAGTDLRLVLFFVTGTDEDDNTNELLCYIDTGSNLPVNSNGSNHDINFSALGVLNF